MTTRDERRLTAIASARETAARIWAGLAATYCEGGAEAVAGAAWSPGSGLSRAETARTYEGWRQEEISKKDAAREPGAA